MIFYFHISPLIMRKVKLIVCRLISSAHHMTFLIALCASKFLRFTAKTLVQMLDNIKVCKWDIYFQQQSTSLFQPSHLSIFPVCVCHNSVLDLLNSSRGITSLDISTKQGLPVKIYLSAPSYSK